MSFYTVSLAEVAQTFVEQGWSVDMYDTSSHDANVGEFVAYKLLDVGYAVPKHLYVTLCGDGKYTLMQEDISHVSRGVDMTLPDFVVAQSIILGSMSIGYLSDAETGVEELQDIYSLPRRSIDLMNKLSCIVEDLGVGWERTSNYAVWEFTRVRHDGLLYESLRLHRVHELFTVNTYAYDNVIQPVQTVQSPSLTMTACALWNAYFRLSGLGNAFGDDVPVAPVEYSYTLSQTPPDMPVGTVEFMDSRQSREV